MVPQRIHPITKLVCSILLLVCTASQLAAAPLGSNEDRPEVPMDNISTSHLTSTSQMTMNGVSVGEMKMPFDKNFLNNQGISLAKFSGGPHGANDTTYSMCNKYPLTRLSGIDFAMENGTEVLAVQAGTVITATAATYAKVSNEYEVMIDHGGWTTRYWHLSNNDAAKSLVGKVIPQGQVIGESGQGHVHVELQADNATGAGKLNVLSWHGMVIDGYTVYSVLNAENDTEGLNYQGILVKGAPQPQPAVEYSCGSKKRSGIRIFAADNRHLEANEPYPPVTSTNTKISQLANVNDISVALIIDGTGSMQTYDPNGMRKAAAKVFIDAISPPNSRVAVVGFDSNIYNLASLSLIASDIDKEPLKKAVDQVGERFLGTDINAGLRGGYNQLLLDTTSSHKFAILLTDGEHNQGAYQPQSHLQFQAKGWPVYTIGLGEGVDMTLLRQIASETGGECVNNCQPLSDPTLLQSTYFNIVNRIALSKLSLNTSFTMQQGESKQLATSVRPDQSSATFLASWPGSEVTMVLTSPSGKQIMPATAQKEMIAFASARDGDFEVYSMNIDGTSLQQLTNNTLIDTEPSWSPDGNRVAFARHVGGKYQIFTMHADGSNQQPLLISDFSDYSSIWSPDGSQLMFTRFGDLNGTTELRSDVFIMNADGTNPIRLTNSTGKTGSNLDSAAVSGWSPDGQYILFTWFREGRNQAWIMRKDGSEQLPLLTDNYSNFHPQISPDGTRIVFASTRNGDAELYLIGRGINGVYRLTNTNGTNMLPRWSTDGYRIIFTSTRAGKNETFWMKPDGSQQYALTPATHASSVAVWRPQSFQETDLYYAKSATYVLYTVPNPEQGEWIINLFGASLDPSGETVTVQVTSQDLLPYDVFLPLTMQ